MNKDMNPNKKKCPFCDERLEVYDYSMQDKNIFYVCSICGNFLFSDGSEDPIFDDIQFRNIISSTGVELNEKIKVLLSHTIKKNQKKTETGRYSPVKISPDWIKEVIQNRKFPKTPQEQVDNLILWLGNNSEIGEKTNKMSYKELKPIIVAHSEDNVSYILEYLHEIKVITKTESIVGVVDLEITPKGWERFEELKKGTIESKKVFMAMQFIDHENYGLDDMFKYFQKAVTETGFELFRADTEPKAGSIPDHIIADISKSKFVIADLTYKNPNVYWEAGYAEALNKPVIYTCCHDFEKNFENTPFDIRHKRAVNWNKDKLDEAAKELKGVIRGTFPDTADLEDRRE